MEQCNKQKQSPGLRMSATASTASGLELLQKSTCCHRVTLSGDRSLDQCRSVTQWPPMGLGIRLCVTGMYDFN